MSFDPADAARRERVAALAKALAEASARYKAMTPAERAAHDQAQRESWARGMAPCEHGVADWEQCAACHEAINARPRKSNSVGFLESELEHRERLRRESAARLAQAFEPPDTHRVRWDMAAIAIGAGLTVAAALCAAVAALAEPMHSTADPGHWYDPECCSLRDCAPIPRDRVKLGRAGAVVRLSRGDHPTVEGSVERFFRDPAVEVQGQKAWRWSQDDNWHACITPGAQQFICLYAPRGGT